MQPDRLDGGAAAGERLAHDDGDHLHDDAVGKVEQPQEDADDAVLVAPTPTTAAGDGPLVPVETENRQHRAAAPVALGLPLAVFEAVPPPVLAGRLRHWPSGPQVRPREGRRTTHTQRSPPIGRPRLALGLMARNDD